MQEEECDICVLEEPGKFIMHGSISIPSGGEFLLTVTTLRTS